MKRFKDFWQKVCNMASRTDNWKGKSGRCENKTRNFSR